MKYLILILIISATIASAKRPPSRIPMKNRVVAIGDVHGDFNATKEALKIAKVMNDNEEWIGGDTILVQTGDQLDRGNGEKKLIDLLEKLKPRAQEAGGDIFVLNGNHETMNVDLDLRYVTQTGYKDFDHFYDRSTRNDHILLKFSPYQRGRVVAFRPGGPYAKIFGNHNTLMIIGKTLFLHGGLTPKFMDLGIENINKLVSNWMKGIGPRPPLITNSKGPLWSRDYSSKISPKKCIELNVVLNHLNLTRMVVAHTAYNQINSACNEKVWRIDVGMSAHYGGRIEVLEILQDTTINILN